MSWPVDVPAPHSVEGLTKKLAEELHVSLAARVAVGVAVGRPEISTRIEGDKVIVTASVSVPTPRPTAMEELCSLLNS